MKNRFFPAALTLCGLIFAAAPLMAHHSFAAQYDRSKPATLVGPVVRVDWINPHARIYMDAKDATGKVQRWEIELSAPAMLMRQGWTSKALKAGDEVTVAGSLAKDGSNLLNASSVKLGEKVIFRGTAETDTP
jgi:Family of unknown function (DUF6152)